MTQQAVPAIAVIGAGAWGTALANAAAVAGCRVTLWARDAAQIAAMRQNRSNQARLPDVPLHERVTPEALLQAAEEPSATRTSMFVSPWRRALNAER